MMNKLKKLLDYNNSTHALLFVFALSTTGSIMGLATLHYYNPNINQTYNPMNNITYIKLMDLDVNFSCTTTLKITTTKPTTKPTTTIKTTTTKQTTTSSTTTTTTTTKLTSTSSTTIPYKAYHPTDIPISYRACFTSADCCITDASCCPCEMFKGKQGPINCNLIDKYRESLNCGNHTVYCRLGTGLCNYVAGCVPKFVNGQYAGHYCELVGRKWSE